MKVWKIASRWSNTGTKESSILDIFRKYGIVFAGRETQRIQNSVKEGDVIAISDGNKIVSVAKAISLPTKITSFEIDEDDKKRFDYENWVIGFKVDIYNLNESEIFSLNRGRTFHKINEDSVKVEELFTSKISTTNFKINTYTYNLFDSNSESTSLIQKGLKYIIPVYQRPYSWNELQIETFLNDIFISYWGTEKRSQSESMFIGTMQLSEKKYSDENNNYQEIIDGQQRITTLTLLLKALYEKYQNNEVLKDFDFKWLDTDVNRGQQSKNLKEVLFSNKFDNELNKYAINYKLLKKYFKLNISNDEDGIEFKEDNFITHLLTNLYFVVIETKAGLSKTLQIFNAINTTGLDLNSTDVFKIRLYEYLSNDGDNKEVFEKIDMLYEKIDINNSKANGKVIDMDGILGIYKSFLIAKYGLNMTLWRMGTGTFFEQLFDTVLNIKQWSGFTTLKEETDFLKIEDIDKIINIRFEWQEKHYGANGNFDDFDTMLSLRLFWWSRYSKYWNLAFLYLMKDDATDEKYNQLIQELSKLYISYTLLFQKQTNEIHRFTKEVFENLVMNKKNIDEVLRDIRDKYLAKEDSVKKVISGNIFWNPKIKNILTRMSASIEEKNNKSTKEIEQLIFNTKIDVEHIKSRNDGDFDDITLKEDWSGILNTMGNLMILEYSINRSIGNKPFNEKVLSYKNSDFFIVNNFSKKYSSWDLDSVKKRKKEEEDKVFDFLY